MRSDIGITMLGASQSGKTCYMLAMYSIMSIGVRGFTFTTQDPDDDLELSIEWGNLEQKAHTHHDSWTDPTTISKDWRFDCSYGFKKIKGFTWHDYRGGALLDRNKPEDRSELLQKFALSSCVILCISGEELSDYVQGNKAVNLQVTIRQFNSLMKTYREQNNKTAPVVIAITKADLCTGETLNKGVEAITEKMLPTLFTRGGDWTVMICPVSLGQDEVDGFDINPINVHIPVTFAIFTALQTDINNTEEAIRLHKNSINDRQSEIDRLGRNGWFAFWNSNEIAYERHAVSELEKQTGLKQSECETLKKNLNLLKNELFGEQFYMFHDGRRFAL